MEQLSALIYCSRVSPDLLIGGVYDILAQSTRHNAEQELTGMMLFNSRYFLQAIEGPHDSVVRLREKIRLDDRHRDFTMLGHKKIKSRTWANWSMSLVTPTPANRSIFEKYNIYGGLDPYRLRFSQAHALLLQLAKHLVLPVKV